MESEQTLDLPPEIIEKLRNLELELEDGDITLKGFEKKKASLLAAIPPRSSETQKTDTEILAELGPEPSAADVVDFLDFLPSPTHSPTRTVEAVNFMEQNHRQIQQQQQQQQQQHYHQPQYNSIPPPTPSHQQQYLYQRPPPQQQQQQQQAYRPVSSNYYTNSPAQNNRPYMVPRNGYSQPQPRPIPQGYYSQRPPQNMIYRPQGPPPITSQPITTSPRPMYRPSPNANPNNNYRPQFGNYNTYNTDIRSSSTNITSSSTMVNQYDQRQYHSLYSNRDTSTNTLDTNPLSAPSPPSIKKVKSVSSLNASNPARFSSPPPPRFAKTPVGSTNKRVNLSKYGNATMAKTFQNVEPILQPRQDMATIEEFAGRQILPSLPRDIPFKVVDVQDKQDPTLFHSVAELLRYRASNSQGRLIPAFTQVDDKGKDMASLTWEKLAARSEKVAMVLREKSSLQSGDRVALIYRKSEVLDFVVSLLGCFIAGVVAVPINAIEELSELWFILRVSNVRLVLTTDSNLKTLTKNMKARNIEFPKEVDWWPTNDFGSLYSHQIKSGKYHPLQPTPLAYIEYTKSMNGELKGVAVSHQSIMHQCHGFAAATTETVVLTNPDGTTSILPRDNTQQTADTLLTYLEPRQQLGLNISILCSIYKGSHTIFTSANIMETPAVWIHLMSKHKVTMALTGYPGLFYAAKYYQRHTKEIMQFSKKVTPDLSPLRLLLVDTMIVKPDTNEYIANKLLGPLSQHPTPIDIITPILSLPEHAGAILSFRDYLGPGKLEELDITYNAQDNTTTTTRKNVTFALGKSRDVWECILDADALRRKKVVVLATTKSDGITGGDEAGCLKVASHGFPFPQCTMAVVDPETLLLCPPDTIGEIWVDGPSLADGFWGIPGLTDVVYHARPVLAPSENTHPDILDQQFVRTGLLGTMIGRRVVVLGMFEERVRQQRLGQELGFEEVHIASDLLNTITKKTRIDSCTMFDIYVNGQYLPILAIESNASTDEIKNVIDNLSDVVMALHGLRLYAVVAVNKGQLPRYLKDGNQYIHHLMTKKHFLAGRLPIKYIKMDVDRTIFNEASSLLYQAEPNNAMTIWQSNVASYERALALKVISPRVRAQHTGIEMINSVVDERSNYDLSRFSNVVDMMLWRTSLYPEETAFVGFSQGNTKPYSWRRFNNQIATLANYFIKKCLLKPATPVMVLMHFGIDLVRTLYACFVAGIIPILCPPPDIGQTSQKRIQDDVNLMVRTIHDLKLQHMIVNSQSEDVLGNKTIQAAIKITTTHQRKLIHLKRLPDQINIDKAPRFNKLLGPESGLSVKSEWTSDKRRPAFVLIQQNPTDDYLSGAHQYIPYTHDTILHQCRAQKLTCQIKFQKPLIVTGLNGFESLGLLQGAFCGVFVGCATILIPSMDFRNNTIAYFELIARNKCPTMISNYLLFDYVMSRVTPNDQRQIPLPQTQNVMLSVTSRTKPKFYERITRQLSLSRVERDAVSTVYTHALNPMITTRSYMCIEPISLIADLEWLRQGIVRPLSQTDETSYGVLLHDSGIVPTNTMVAIVNPEKQVLCPSNVIGEIWVSSDSNVKGLYGTTKYDPAMFEATIQGSDQKVKYMRTGDIGFLWNVHRKTVGGGAQQGPIEEGQCLYVLGHMTEIITSKGLAHFAVDIEETVETCHPDILSEGCYVIQTESKEIIVIIAIKPNSGNALHTVPIIVSSILERHSLLIDTIVMVNKDQLPKKLNGEKLRKIVLYKYIRKEISAISVTGIKNQHQPVNLPQWHNTVNSFGATSVDYSDNQSVISFSQRSQLNFEASLHRQPVPTVGSIKSRKSFGAESVWE